MKEPREEQPGLDFTTPSRDDPLTPPLSSASAGSSPSSSGPAGSRGFGRRLLGAVIAAGARISGSATLWVPAGLCLQFALLGLRPIWLEGRRLEERGLELEQRAAALRADRELFLCEASMLEDPIYRERVRRSRGERGSRPLLLDDALDPARRER